MRICVFLVIIVDIAADEDVADSLEVLTRHVLSVHDRQANLVVLDGLGSDVPNFLQLVLLVAWFDLEPASDDTLRERSALVVDLTILNGLLLNRLPVAVEETIVQVDTRLAN